MEINKIADLIEDVANFPKDGINFKDITPILANGDALRSLAQLMARSIDVNVTTLLAIESRGFILASAIAQHHSAGVVLVRKPGKLPRSVYSYSYELEYGQDTLQVHKDQLTAESRVMVIDDVLATGGTAQAVERLCQMAGAEVIGHRFMLELKFLAGASKLTFPHKSMITID